MTAPRILVVNGPNLNTLGRREPEIYGRQTLAELEARIREVGESLGFEIDCLQSNSEGTLIDRIQHAREDAAGIVINPAALGHYSIALLDALLYTELPIIEVHLSNIHRREQFRHHSVISGAAEAVIAGAGPRGYEFALRLLADRILPELSA